MAEQVTITNLSDGGSRERVAFDLFVRTIQYLPAGKDGVERIKQCLDLYAQCLNATNRSGVDTSKLT